MGAGDTDKRPREYRTRKDTAFLTIVAGALALGFKFGLDTLGDLKTSQGSTAPIESVRADLAAEVRDHISKELAERDRENETRFRDLKEDIRELRVIVLSRGRK